MFTPSDAKAAFCMTSREKRSSISLASIFALRMLGLFVILPVFAVYARHLPGGDSEFLVGVTLGIYGLTQGILQIPFGIASDRLGRKPVIAAGLLIFAAGSFVAAASDSIWSIMLGRMLQGAGAISAAVTAFISDSVRDRVLTKAMAMVGASIGLTFALSLIISPLLAEAVGVSGIFGLTGILALAAVWVIWKVVPDAPSQVPSDLPEEAVHKPWQQILTDPQLLRLNIGIFSLHAALTAIFVVMPTRLASLGLPAAHHWWIYLPAVLVGFALMAPPIAWGERRGRTVAVVRAAVLLLAVVFLLLALFLNNLWEAAILLALFFVGFNVLEATLPGLISREAPKADKGLALGIYNTTQNIGLFIGGAAGGWIAQHWGSNAVFAAALLVMLLWFASAAGLKEPPRPRREPGSALQLS